LTSATDGGGQLHAPAALPRGNSPRHPLKMRLSSLEAVEKRKISGPCRQYIL
jgi:hypothetical protein